MPRSEPPTLPLGPLRLRPRPAAAPPAPCCRCRSDFRASDSSKGDGDLPPCRAARRYLSGDLLAAAMARAAPYAAAAAVEKSRETQSLRRRKREKGKGRGLLPVAGLLERKGKREEESRPARVEIQQLVFLPAQHVIILSSMGCHFRPAALSVSFNSLGTKIFAGYDKILRVFDVRCPGRDFEQHSLLKGNDGPPGIASSIAFSPTHNGMLAIGSYNQTTAVYAEDNMELLYVLHGQMGGVTHVLFSKDGNYIYTGGRKDPYILCWDIRNTGATVYKLYRSAEYTNQRVYFDIEPCGRHLGTGGQDGLVHIYDLQTGQWKIGFQAASDTVNGFSFHPTLPLAATSSGNRRFCMPEIEEDFSLKDDENCASVWTFSASGVGNAAPAGFEPIEPGTEIQDLHQS